MKREVTLSIRGRQHYLDQDPEIIELITQGVLEKTEKGWRISYEETDLTGLMGVTTTFLLEPDCIVLDRKGPLTSRMVFREGVAHDSLYQMDFGALLITVCATRIFYEMSEQGGVVELVYNIDIEQSQAGMIDYRLEIRIPEA